jgi:hypothetical protein
VPTAPDELVANSVLRQLDTKLLGTFDLKRSAYFLRGPLAAKGDYRVLVLSTDTYSGPVGHFWVTEEAVMDRWWVRTSGDGPWRVGDTLALEVYSQDDHGFILTKPGSPRPTVTKVGGDATIGEAGAVGRYGTYLGAVELTGPGTLRLRVEGWGKSADLDITVRQQ